eukprot:scaffold6266_cov279-Chaetoceros_neogracile.AAC.3
MLFITDYGENKGASYARNTGYTYSPADWVLFLDDDVVPDASILDAYVGSIARYPKAKCMVGLTKLPHHVILQNLQTPNPSSVGSHGKSDGARIETQPHSSVQAPMKKFYKTNGFVVAVPEALVNHPYWNNGGTCYGQIGGWANADSLVLSEWPEKTFLVFLNWIESTFLVVLVYGGFWWKYMTSDTTILSLVGECGSIAAIDHLVKILTYYGSTKGHVDGEKNRVVVWVHRIVLAFGASTVISSQKSREPFVK